LEQFEDSDDDECMSPSDSGSKLEAENSSSTGVSSAGAGSEKATLGALEVHECAFCRSEVIFISGFCFRWLSGDDDKFHDEDCCIFPFCVTADFLHLCSFKCFSPSGLSYCLG